MTPAHFRIAKHLTAGLAALAAAGLLVFGFDGVLSAMQKLTRIYATPTPSAAPEAAPAATPATPGVVPAFVVPADPAGSGSEK